jgi:hypothetical protein
MISAVQGVKGFFLATLLFFFSGSCLCQTYISVAPCLTNSPGTLLEKSNLAVEIGRQWDVFSLGLDIGKTSLGKMMGHDTSVYLELRPNLNIFQQGRFTNTFTAGIGFIFNSKQDLMTELTSGIEYACSDKLHFNIYFGQYFYSGKTDASNVTFFGASVMLYFSGSNAKPLITQPKRQ